MNDVALETVAIFLWDIDNFIINFIIEYKEKY